MNFNAHKNAFINYIRTGFEMNLAQLESEVYKDKEGPGFLLPPEMLILIENKIRGNSILRKICNVTTISTESLEYVSEAGKISIFPEEQIAAPKTTQKNLDDMSLQIANWLIDGLQSVFLLRETEAFIKGDGNSKPSGIFNSGIEEKLSKIDCENIISLFYDLPEQYSRNSSFLMSRNTLSTVRLLRDTTGNLIFTPSIHPEQPDTLIGQPCYVTLMEDNIIAVADFKSAYQIVDKPGIRVLRDPLTEKPFVKFNSIRKVGGRIIDRNAIRILKHI